MNIPIYHTFSIIQKNIIFTKAMKKIITDFDALYNYWLWYYLKYFSSRWKVREKLLEKSYNNTDLTEKVLEKMDVIIEEEANTRARIKHLLFRNKNINYIKTNLYQKKYDKEIVEKLLKEEFIKEDESLLSENFLMKKVTDYKEKGKSRQYIFSKLIERKPDKALLESILNQVFLEWDSENLLREYEKIKGKFEKNKIIEKLLRKGFFYDDIKRVINK